MIKIEQCDALPTKVFSISIHTDYRCQCLKAKCI